jgi:hypothetical protein
MGGKPENRGLENGKPHKDFHSFHRGVERCGKKLCEGLDIMGGCSKITNGSVLAKSVGPCRGFTVGSEVIQGTDPIVRRLISTG